MLQLLGFVREALLLVGTQLVLQQVIPLFDYNVQSSSTASVTTTQSTTTTANETVLPDLLPGGTIVGQSYNRVVSVPFSSNVAIGDSIESRIIETDTATEETTSIVITLTKNTIDAETNMIVDSQEFTVEIPSYALYGWWSRMITFIQTRSKTLDIIVFLNVLAELEDLNDDLLLAAFKSAGCGLTVEELGLIKKDASPSDELGLARLFQFLQTTVKLVGADLVAEQVLPLFDYNITTANSSTTVNEMGTTSKDVIVVDQENSTTLHSNETTTTSTSVIEITLTKQSVDPVTNLVIDTQEFNFEIPLSHLDGWWYKLVTTITTRFTSFNILMFIERISTCSNLTESSLLEAFASAGAPMTVNELADFTNDAGIKDDLLQDQVQGPTVAVAAEEVAKDEIIAVELKETPAAPAGATDQVDTAVVSSTTTTTTTTTTVTDTSVTEPSVSVSALIPAPYVTEDGKTVNPDGPAQLTLTLKNSTEEVNVVVPEHAKGNWWTLLLQAITRRFSGFDSSAFLEAISKHEEITETTIVETLNQCGATVTKEELVTIQDECGCKGEASLVNLLTFVKRIIKIVGVTTFLTTVVSTLETSTSTVTTTTTTSTEETTGTAAPTSGEEVVFVDLKETAVVVEDVTATTTTGSAETCEPAAVVAETVEQVVETTVVTEETTVIDAAATATTAKKPAESWFSKATRIVKDGAVAAGGAVLHAGEVAGSAVAYGAQAAGSTVVEGVTVVGSAVKSGAEAAGSAAVSGATSAGSLISDGASAAGSALKYTAGAVGTAAVVGAVAVGAAAVGAGELAGSAAKTVGTAVVEGGEVALSSTVSAVKTTAGVAVDAAGAAGSAITYVADATGSAVVSGAAAVAGLVAGSSESAESVTETVTTETITTTTTIVEQDQVQGPTVAVAAEEVAKDEIIAVELKETPAAPAGATDQVDTAVVSSTTTTTTTTTTVTDTSVTEPSVSVSALIPAPYVTEDGKTVNPDGPAQLTLTLKNSTEEVNVVVPEHAKGNWWTLLLQAITRRFSGFDSSAFLEAISKHEEITETTIVETLNQCGATVTKEELVTIQDECGCKGEASLVNLLTFVKRIIKIVGVTTFLTTVVSTLETSTSTVTTTTTTSTEETTGTAAPTSGEEVVFVDLKETAVVVEDVTATTTTGSAETCEPAAVVAETVEQVVETTVVTEETTVIDAAATATTAKKPAESWFSKATRIVKDGAVAAGGAVLHAGEVAGSAVAYGAQAAGSTVVEGVTVVGSAVKSGAEAAGSAAVSGATSAGSLISDGASAAGSALKYTAGAVGTAAVVGAVAVGAAAVGAGELAGSAAKTVGTAVVEGGEVALSSTVSAVKTTAGVAVDAAGAAGSAITYVADATGSAVVSGAAAVAGLVAGSSESAESVTETVTTETITTTTTIVEQDQVQGPTVAVAAEEVAKDEIIAVELKETPAAPAGATDQVDTAVVSSTTTTTTTTTTVTDTSVTEPSVSVSALIPAPYVTEDGKTVNPDGPAQLTLTLKNSTEEVNVVVPEHAKGNWWTLLLQAITRRFSGFDSSAFLEAISKHEEITETTIVETLNQCGATVTKEELVTIQDECGCKGEASLVNLLTFVKRIIKIVGVTTFLTTVVSTLETSTSTVTTTTTTSTEETTGTAAPTSGEEVVFVDLKETAVVVEDVTATTTTGSAETCEPAAVVAETVEHVVKSAETFTETAETESLVVTLTQQTLDESNNVISSTFVSCLVAAPDASDASVLAALKSAEAPLALDEFAGVKAATGADFDLHLAFVKSAGETVGSDLFVDQVAPILESSV
ncbi:hypothetical protein DFJ73DRAFT_777198 [Zopfochytrium polystomum]|nr:hypothetical protein DFJ73DRAFT_777198 [Zopfochytrium polystomum]